MPHVACLLAALCFLISNAIRVVLVVERYRNRGLFSGGSLKGLDAGGIQDRWDFIKEDYVLRNVGTTFRIFGWFLFAIPVLELAWYLSRMGKRKIAVHGSMVVFALGGCLVEVMSQLFAIGINGTTTWISDDFNLETWVPQGLAGSSKDWMGWKVFELIHLGTRGFALWVDAFEWVCLMLVLVLLYYSVGTQQDRQRKLSMAFARFGLLIALLCVVDLTADLLRLEEWRLFTFIAIITTIVNSIIFIPAWLILLSLQMQGLSPRLE